MITELYAIMQDNNIVVVPLSESRLPYQSTLRPMPYDVAIAANLLHFKLTINLTDHIASIGYNQKLTYAKVSVPTGIISDCTRLECCLIDFDLGENGNYVVGILSNSFSFLAFIDSGVTRYWFHIISYKLHENGQLCLFYEIVELQEIYMETLEW